MNPVSFFDIYTDDLERARAFYEAVLQVSMPPLGDPAKDRMRMYAFPGKPEQPGAMGALCHMEGNKPGAGGTMVYFASQDCDTESARVEAAGGKVIRPKFSIAPFGFVALCMGTESNVFGLHSMQ